MKRLLLGLALFWALPVWAEGCGDEGVFLQVLGSGGPEMVANRASTSYLIWQDGAARALIDAGGGSALRFGESGARGADLDVILFTQLQVEHTVDLPAIALSTWLERRARPLPIFGPGGNNFMPSTVALLRTLFDNTRGAYRYMGDVLSPRDRGPYKLRPLDVMPRNGQMVNVFGNNRLGVMAVAVPHGTIPALAWAIVVGGKRIVITGDAGDGAGLERLADGADLLVAHESILEDATAAERALDMTPSSIGQLAHASAARHLVLAHRTPAMRGRETETAAAIKRSYTGPLSFANDLECFRP